MQPHIHTYLRKQLLEVLKRQLRAVAEGGQGRVVAHAAQRLGPRFCHGDHQHLQGLAGVPVRTRLSARVCVCAHLRGRGLNPHKHD